MKRIACSLVLGSTICLLSLPLGIVHAQARYVRGLRNCGKYAYDHNEVIIENTCDTDVTIDFTSRGNVSGQVHLGPASDQSTGRSLDEVNGAGGLNLFTCPGRSMAVDTQRRPVGPHYNGEYECLAP